MISTRFVKIAVSGLALGIALTGGHSADLAPSTATTDSKQQQIAAESASKATAALAALNYRSAVRLAESAVEYAPRNAAYRMLLGQAYLGAGRFASAETSFADTLSLAPDNARAALNLALTEIAQGKRDRALSTLSDYREKFTVSDYGLAVGLAGDVDRAIMVLEAAIRSGDSDAKTRQNLALSYAMAGRWSNARVMAMQDLSGNDVNDRIAQWASFVRPGSTFDQVASLLGVTPARDAGQPTRLALNGFTDPAVAVAEPVEQTPVANLQERVETALAAPAAPTAFETPASAAEATAPSVATSSAVLMGDRREVVQPLPASYAAAMRSASMILAEPNAPKQMVVAKTVGKPAFTTALAKPRPAMRSVEAGKFVVQLGAFENASVSRDAWKRMAPRFGLLNYDPANSAAKVSGTSFVRLSVGGFANRVEAQGVCSRIRHVGGTCFVRGLLGDAPAYWVQRGMPKGVKPVRVASR